MATAMMSSAKARPENAELERRVKRRLQLLQRKRCPASRVVPSFVTLPELHRGHTIDNVLLTQPIRPHSPAREPSEYVSPSFKTLNTRVPVPMRTQLRLGVPARAAPISANASTRRLLRTAA